MEMEAGTDWASSSRLLLQPEVMPRQPGGPPRPRPAPQPSLDLPGGPFLSQVSAAVDPRRARLREASQLPSWAWAVLRHSLGLRSPPGVPDRGQVATATALFVITLFLSLLLTATSGFFLVFDVLSAATHSTVFTGTADVLLGLAWVFAGPYANLVAHRVLSSPALAADLRLHTRRLCRVSSGLLLLLLSAAGVAVRLVSSWPNQGPAACRLIDLHPLVCLLRRWSGAGYAALVVYWNLLAAWLLLAVCRSRTIAARRLIRELEFEGKVLEKVYALRAAEAAADNAKRSSGDPPAPLPSAQSPAVVPSDFMGAVESETDDEEASGARELRDVARSHTEDSPEPPSTALGDATTIFRRLEAEGAKAEAYERLLLTSEDLCMRYWALGCRLRVTSLVFQRWTATWGAVVAIWALSYVVHWINHRATLLDLADFFIPVVLISVVCAAYAEVNLECARVLDSVAPRPERIYVNRFLASRPAALTVYSMPLNYQVIAGLVVAFAVAFVSRIVMDEFDRK